MALLGLGACASNGRVVRHDEYLSRVEARVKAAKGTTTFRLRANPTACECPPFEVLLGEVWQRAEIAGLEAEDPLAVRLDGMVQAHDARVVVAEGKIEEAIGMCARGALYVSLVVTALAEEPGGEVVPVVPGPSSSERR